MGWPRPGPRLPEGGPASCERILRPGHYHAVVAQPALHHAEGQALNHAYRERYSPATAVLAGGAFIERFFSLGGRRRLHRSDHGQWLHEAGVRQEADRGVLAEVDLTHVVDTAGAYIPGHGTPTVILFGRNRAPVASTCAQ